MNGNAHTRLLFEALEDNSTFSQRGFAAHYRPNAVLVERSGHFRGIWTSRAEALVWTAAGYNEPTFATSSLPEAVSFTLGEISRH